MFLPLICKTPHYLAAAYHSSFLHFLSPFYVPAIVQLGSPLIFIALFFPIWHAFFSSQFNGFLLPFKSHFEIASTPGNFFLGL